MKGKGLILPYNQANSRDCRYNRHYMTNKAKAT